MLGMGQWNSVHITLKDKKLKIFNQESDKLAQAIINFDAFNTIMQPYESDKLQFNISLDGKDKVFHFKTNTAEASLQWQKEIKNHINVS